ncbi:hypothetical protein BS47DRAFT_1346141 [Hydnum rufescens UP504]|uniref:Uncharacterized protein n=1 Tax=Hydnum rufescens UP504 TaxID=1448309 RepID=A0A9P6AU51_9AGAM|nr:hypothetical protein BS47DRAFT_1346141 [Hydnum rufescens UP504]
MSRSVPEDAFSSSPARPSHTRNPYAQQVKRNLKRTASVASLPSPPHSTAKRAHYGAGVVWDAQEKAIAKRSSVDDERASSSGTSPALGLLAIQETAGRSPSPFDDRSGPSATLPAVVEEEPQIGGGGRGRAAEDSITKSPRPTTPIRSPVTPSPTRKRENKRGHPGPIRDSPNNPFLSSSPRRPRPNKLGKLEERETIDYVFRGVKTTFANPYAKKPLAPGEVDPSTLDPRHPDYSPDPTVVPKLLWPSSARSDGKSSLKTTGKGRSYPVSRRLFSAEIAKQAEASANVASKAKDMQEAVKKGKMSGSMVIAQAHGPIRNNETAAPGLSRAPSYIPKPAKNTAETNSTSSSKDTEQVRRPVAPSSKTRTGPSTKPTAPGWRV